MKAQVAWRVLTPKQVQIIKERLFGTTGTIRVAYVEGDPEALNFAYSIIHTLYLHHIVTDVSIYANSYGSETELVSSVFRAALISFSPAAPPSANKVHEHNDIPTSPAVTIMIGSRPPPT